MFETSGSYVLLKRFRRENAENSLAPINEPKEKVSPSPQRSEKLKQESKKKTIKKQDVLRSHDKPVSDAPFKAVVVYWLRAILYYIIFYAAVIILFYICFTVYGLTLPVDAPRVLKLQPSLVYYPNYESYFLNRISWNAFKEIDVKLIVNNINSFLEKSGTRREFGNCRANNSYGYKSRNPCVFLKVNRIADFHVEPIEDSNELTRDQRVLKKFIKHLPRHKRKGRLWISCKSNSWVKIEYYPHTQSIPMEQINSKPTMYGTKRNISTYSQSDYARILTIQIKNVPKDVLFNVHCKMFAKNIENGDHEKPWIGGVSFDMILLTE